MSTIDQQFVEYIVKSLVSHPEDIAIERVIDDKGTLLTLTVHPEDLGRVIGRRGSTAQSVRTLLRALASKNGERYNLKIVNNDGFTGAHEDGDQYTVDNSTDEAVETASSYAENARKELAELDDLDI